MIVAVNGCHDVRVIPGDDNEVRLVVSEPLRPYLPGIVVLHGLGHVNGDIVELDQRWSGWTDRTATRPKTATIVTHPLLSS